MEQPLVYNYLTNQSQLPKEFQMILDMQTYRLKAYRNLKKREMAGFTSDHSLISVFIKKYVTFFPCTV